MGRSSLSLKDPVQLFFVCGMRLLDVYHKKINSYLQGVLTISQ